MVKKKRIHAILKMCRTIDCESKCAFKKFNLFTNTNRNPDSNLFSVILIPRKHPSCGYISSNFFYSPKTKNRTKKIFKSCFINYTQAAKVNINV